MIICTFAADFNSIGIFMVDSKVIEEKITRKEVT